MENAANKDNGANKDKAAKNEGNTKSGVMLKYIIYFLGLELASNASPVVVLFNVAMISLVLCFINVFGYLIAFYLLEYYKIEKKYP
ncbi:hypothetical protein Golomagni_00003 [Golovinomyces magnicellulatus]|nr:hypothetical protein Golomagni_00003 [Golovinomyces magnicellulatus]